MFKSKKTRRPKMPAWFIARAALVAAALFFAAFAVFYWGKPLWSGSPALAVFVGGGFLLSAIVTPTIAPKLAHARGIARAGLLGVCIVFGCVDALGMAGAFRGLESDMTDASFKAAIAVHESDLAALVELRDSAQAKIDAVPIPDATGSIRKAETYLSVVALPTADRDDAQARIDKLVYPVRESIFNMKAIAALSVAMQIALAIGLLSVEAARVRVYSDAMSVYEKGLEKSRKKRSRPAPQQKPRLVAAND